MPTEGTPNRPRRWSRARPDPADADEGPPTQATRTVSAAVLDDEPTGPQPAGPGASRPPRRHRILPRSVIGISMLILSFALGSGFSGVVLYSYYQYRLNQNTDRVNQVVNGYQKAFANAQADLKTATNADVQTVRNELAPLQQAQAGPQAVTGLVNQLAPSVFFVHTLDASGQPAVGTAFVVSSSARSSLLITSYSTVVAATRSPAPPVYVRQGTTDTPVTVTSWDPQYDLALLTLGRGGLTPVTTTAGAPSPQVGDKLYAVSGLGSAGASLSAGTVTDVSAGGVAETAPINASFAGGPLINLSGQVVGVVSQTYTPLGFASGTVWYAPYLEAACNKVLSCPGGTLPTGA